MSEERFEDLQEPGEPPEDADVDGEDEPDDGEPWAKTSSGDADEI
jgi:hypothetical protein